MAVWGVAAALLSLLLKWPYGYTGTLLRLYSRGHEFHPRTWNWSKLISDPDNWDVDGYNWLHGSIPEEAAELKRHSDFRLHIRSKRKKKGGRAWIVCSEHVLSPFLSCANAKLATSGLHEAVSTQHRSLSTEHRVARKVAQLLGVLASRASDVQTRDTFCARRV